MVMMESACHPGWVSRGRWGGGTQNVYKRPLKTDPTEAGTDGWPPAPAFGPWLCVLGSRRRGGWSHCPEGLGHLPQKAQVSALEKPRGRAGKPGPGWAEPLSVASPSGRAVIGPFPCPGDRGHAGGSILVGSPTSGGAGPG